MSRFTKITDVGAAVELTSECGSKTGTPAAGKLTLLLSVGFSHLKSITEPPQMSDPPAEDLVKQWERSGFFYYSYMWMFYFFIEWGIYSGTHSLNSKSKQTAAVHDVLLKVCANTCCQSSAGNDLWLYNVMTPRHRILSFKLPVIC